MQIEVLQFPKGLDPKLIDVAPRVAYGSESSEIEGIVSASGQGGRPGAEFKVHGFSLAAWRAKGQPLAERDLYVMRPIGPDSDMFDSIETGDTLRLRIRLDDSSSRGVLEFAEKIPADAELAALVEKLSKPVSIVTEQFGELVLDKEVGWFTGKAKWNGMQVKLTLDQCADMDATVSTAETLWSDQAGWKKRVEAYAVENLLPLKNESWLADGERALTPAQFKAKMKLVSVGVAEDGNFTFWHEDGDLFWGHSISIGGDLDKGLRDADIPG